MHAYLQPLKNALHAHASPSDAVAVKAYLRNQFESYGIHAPLRRKLFREFIISNPPPCKRIRSIVRSCWAQEEREWQYIAADLVGACTKEWDEKLISLIEYMLVHKSWWDTVDAVTSELAGPYFRQFPGKKRMVTSRWNQSNNTWLQRSSLLFQIKYREHTDRELLGRYIIRLRGSEEFFVQKAIGWALRTYSRTDPAWVRRFVDTHALPPLSTREATRTLWKY